jgi:hypothetical protein
MKITIDCGGCADKKELHARIAAALSFPDWYGHNLDALMDCLTDLDETTVILTGCSRVAFDAQDFWDTFEDAERENPRLTVIFE